MGYGGYGGHTGPLNLVLYGNLYALQKYSNFSGNHLRKKSSPKTPEHAIIYTCDLTHENSAVSHVGSSPPLTQISVGTGGAVGTGTVMDSSALRRVRRVRTGGSISMSTVAACRVTYWCVTVAISLPVVIPDIYGPAPIGRMPVTGTRRDVNTGNCQTCRWHRYGQTNGRHGR